MFSNFVDLTNCDLTENSSIESVSEHLSLPLGSVHDSDGRTFSDYESNLSDPSPIPVFAKRTVKLEKPSPVPSKRFIKYEKPTGELWGKISKRLVNKQKNC